VRRIKILTIAVLGVCVLGVAGVAGASAQQFHASKTGTLTGKATNTQVFNTGSGAVECTKAFSSGTVTAVLALTQLVTVQYTGCTAFGFINTEITPAQYIFNADNGEVKIENTITITPAGAGCKVTVGPQSLKTVKFKNSGSKLIEESAVKGIVSTSTGGLCGSSGSSGTYTGNNEIELIGGTISWS
jgi:hypothetical protein